MAVVLKDLVFSHIDEALDIDDLENIGDFVRSVITVAGLEEWQWTDALRRLHADLAEALLSASDHASRLRLKAALTQFEGDFGDYLIARETESLLSRNG